MTVQMKDKKYERKKGFLNNEEERIQSFVNQMLVTRIFAACFIGNYHVEQLDTYRCVLRIQTEEKDIIRDLQDVRKRIHDFYRGAVWPAITGPGSQAWPPQLYAPSGLCIWVATLNKSLPLNEKHWFLIKDATISEEGELVLEIKDMRSVNPDVSRSSISNTSDGINIDQIQRNITNFLKETITWNNTKESIKFLFVLVMTIATVTLNGLQYLGDYSIKLFREVNNLIHVLTPIILSLIDLVKRIIGGIFILFATAFGGTRQGPPAPREFPYLQQGPYVGRHK